MRRSILLSMGLGAALFAGIAQGAFIGPLNFENDTAGSIPSQPPADKIRIDTTVMVLDHGTTAVADPFETEDNQSLMIEDTDGSVNNYVGWINKSGAPLTRGRFIADLYSVKIDSDGSKNPILLIQFRNGTSYGGNPGQVFNIQAAGEGMKISGTILDNTWGIGETHRLILDFAFNGDGNVVVSGSLDGEILKAGTTTQFVVTPFSDETHSAATSVNAFNVLSGDTSGANSRVIVDNLSLAVPEPASLSLLGLGGLGLLARRRRR